SSYIRIQTNTTVWDFGCYLVLLSNRYRWGDLKPACVPNPVRNFVSGKNWRYEVFTIFMIVPVFDASNRLQVTSINLKSCYGASFSLAFCFLSFVIYFFAYRRMLQNKMVQRHCNLE